MFTIKHLRPKLALTSHLAACCAWTGSLVDKRFHDPAPSERTSPMATEHEQPDLDERPRVLLVRSRKRDTTRARTVLDEHVPPHVVVEWRAVLDRTKDAGRDAYGATVAPTRVHLCRRGMRDRVGMSGTGDGK